MPVLSLIAKLGLDKTGFDAGLKTAGDKVTEFGRNLAGAFSVLAVVGLVKSVTDTTNRIKDLSEQFRITTDEVQNTDFALAQSGMQFEDLGQSLNKLGQSRRSAVEGNMELRKTFERYGLTLADLNNPQRRTYDLLLQLSGATAKMNLTSREQIELADLLGAKAGKLINVLNELSSIKPPSLFSKDDILAIDRAEKAIKALRLQGQVVVSKPTAMSADVVTTFLKGFQGFMSGFAGGEGFKGRMQGAMAGMDKGMMEGVIGTTFKPVLDALNEGVGGAMKKLLETIFPRKKDDALFEVDKDLKKVKEKAAKGFSIEENSLGRIGAFSGASAQAGLGATQMQQLDKLTKIHDALVRRGIIVRETVP